MEKASFISYHLRKERKTGGKRDPENIFEKQSQKGRCGQQKKHQKKEDRGKKNEEDLKDKKRRIGKKNSGS